MVANDIFEISLGNLGSNEMCSVFQAAIKPFLTRTDRFTVLVMLIRIEMRATHRESQNTSWSNPLRHRSLETNADLHFSSLFSSFRCSVT